MRAGPAAHRAIVETRDDQSVVWTGSHADDIATALQVWSTGGGEPLSNVLIAADTDIDWSKRRFEHCRHPPHRIR